MAFMTNFSSILSRGGAGAGHRLALCAALALAGAGTGNAQAPVSPLNPSGPMPYSGDRDSLLYTGAADVRYRDTSRATSGSYIAATRFQTDWMRRDETGTLKGGARVQLLLETDNQQRTAVNRLRASEMYAFYNFSLPGVSARLKAGQFVLPFGLISVYDTSLQPIQPLYEKALGLRVDTGVMLEGKYGMYRYAGSLTTGAGPDRLIFAVNKVVTFRLSRTVNTPLGLFEVGGSLMSGRGPVTSFNTELPASGYSGAQSYVNKSRIAGDGQYFFGPLTLRGEVIFGGDGNEPVWGYFGEANYDIASRLTVVAERKRWNFPEKVFPETIGTSTIESRGREGASTTGVGLNFDLGAGLTIRTLYEFERDVPLRGDPVITRRLTLQTRLNF